MRRTLLLATLLTAPLPAQDKKVDRIKELEQEAARLEAQLAKVKKELDSLRPRARTPVENLQLPRLEIGHVGPFWSKSMVHEDLKIWRIIDEREMIVHRDRYSSDQVILRMPTKGLAEGRYLEYTRLLGNWEVVETKKYNGRTYYVLEKAREEPRAKEGPPKDRSAPPPPVAKKDIAKAPPKGRKEYSPLDITRGDAEVGDPVRLTGVAQVEPLARGRYALRFLSADGRRRLVVAYVEAADAGPLKAKEKGEWTVTVEGEVTGTSGGTVSLGKAKVTKAETRE